MIVPELESFKRTFTPGSSVPSAEMTFPVIILWESAGNVRIIENKPNRNTFFHETYHKKSVKFKKLITKLIQKLGKISASFKNV